MIKNDLKPPRENFAKAWAELRAKPDAEPSLKTKPAPVTDESNELSYAALDKMIEAMSSEEFKLRINTDREFAAAVNAPRKKKS